MPPSGTTDLLAMLASCSLQLAMLTSQYLSPSPPPPVCCQCRGIYSWMEGISLWQSVPKFQLPKHISLEPKEVEYRGKWGNPCNNWPVCLTMCAVSNYCIASYKIMKMATAGCIAIVPGRGPGGREREKGCAATFDSQKANPIPF